MREKLYRSIPTMKRWQQPVCRLHLAGIPRAVVGGTPEEMEPERTYHENLA